MLRRFLTASVIGTVLLAGGCGGTTVVAPEPPAPSAPPGSPPPLPDPSDSPSFVPDEVEPKPGDETEFISQTGRGTVAAVEYAWHDQGADALAVPPKASYLVITVKVTCEEGECYHNPAAFRVTDGSEDSISFTGGRDGYGPLLGTGTLEKGKEAEGIVTFDLHQQTTSLEFLDEFDDVAGSVKLPD